ncbi:MAG: hypothetical protein HDS81_07585 [Bacteroidales bacterium]|nr:hypothetical protein [Bacteroidales bacterium]
MRTTAERYIDASKEATEKLAKAFGCTDKFVYMALTYRKNGENARKIRHAAVKEYGAVPMCHYPECRTLHDTTEDGRRIMRQTFNNGMTIYIDKETGDAWINNRKGAKVMTSNCITIHQLDELQTVAENM